MILFLIFGILNFVAQKINLLTCSLDKQGFIHCKTKVLVETYKDEAENVNEGKRGRSTHQN